MSVNHANMKLGKGPVKHDKRTLQLAHYLDMAKLPKTPPAWNWGGQVGNWPMMLNDSIGDCTIAAAGHLIEMWTQDTSGKAYTVPDSEILAVYEKLSGYNPTTGAHDDGCVELDVLNYWRNTGIGGHKISAYVALEPKNHNHIELGCYMFGGVYIGVSLPISAQTQQVWAVPPGGPIGDGEPGSWGGHAVPVVWYNSHGLAVVTWGQLKWLTWSFWNTYCDESYAVLSPDWIKNNGRSTSGFDLAALQADLALITH